MANYCMINQENIVTNIIVAENKDVLPGILLLESYDGATIGTMYDPPCLPAPPPTPQEVNARAIAELSMLQTQESTVTQQAIAELSILVAGGGTNGV